MRKKQKMTGIITKNRVTAIIILIIMMATILPLTTLVAAEEPAYIPAETTEEYGTEIYIPNEEEVTDSNQESEQDSGDDAYGSDLPVDNEDTTDDSGYVNQNQDDDSYYDDYDYEDEEYYSDGYIEIEMLVLSLAGGVIAAGETETVGFDIDGDIIVDGGTLYLDSDYTITGTVTVQNGGSFYMSAGTITGAGTRGITIIGTNSTFNMSGGAIVANSADTGGGVFVGHGSTFTMTYGQIANNHATDSSQANGGGGVRVLGSVSEPAVFYMSGGTITSNTTPNSRWRQGGGGVAIGHTSAGGSYFTLSGDALIAYNTSGAQGGGVLIHGNTANRNTFTMNGGTIRNNTARINGGGVGVWGNFNFNSGTISHNVATGNWADCAYPPQAGDINGTGGGVFVGQALGRFTMRDGQITNNNALLGGAIGLSAHVDPPHVYIYGGTISHNTTRSIVCPARLRLGETAMTGYGGAIYMRGTPRVYIRGGLFTRNNAATNGGVIAVGELPGNPPGMLTITGGRFIDNEANNGGAIYTALVNVYPNPSIYIYVAANPVFSNNVARNGANINYYVAYVNSNVIRPGTVTMTNHAFTNHDIYVPTLMDVSIEKYVVNPPNPITIGTVLRYRITITNLINYPVFNLTVTDILPEGLEFVSFEGFTPTELYVSGITIGQPVFTHNDGVITVDIHAIPRHGSLAIDFYLEVVDVGAPSGRILNTAEVAFYNQMGRRRTVRDTETIDVYIPNPNITKTADRNTASVGEEITYTITATNREDEPLEGVFTAVDVIDISMVRFMPETLAVNGVQLPTNEFSFNVTTGELRIPFNTLPSGDTVITFRVEVLPAAEGQVVSNVAILETPPDRASVLPTPPVDVFVPELYVYEADDEDDECEDECEDESTEEEIGGSDTDDGNNQQKPLPRTGIESDAIILAALLVLALAIAISVAVRIRKSKRADFSKLIK
ncbi:MAG: hypothetical protein FWD05_06920 [Oscillospiraceae bacterium]|nr:hypothetical protein [Oscillospiraceae bacterium]